MEDTNLNLTENYTVPAPAGSLANLANAYTGFRRHSVENHNSKSETKSWYHRVNNDGWDDMLEWQANEHILINNYMKEFRWLLNAKDENDEYFAGNIYVNCIDDDRLHTSFNMWVHMREFERFIGYLKSNWDFADDCDINRIKAQDIHNEICNRFTDSSPGQYCKNWITWCLMLKYLADNNYPGDNDSYRGSVGKTAQQFDAIYFEEASNA